MKPKLLVTLVLLVVAPMLLLGGMGVRLARAESLQARQRFEEVLDARLQELDSRITAYARAVEDRLLKTWTSAPPGQGAQREALLATGLVREFVELSPQGELKFPVPALPGNEDFFRRTEVLWESAQLPFGQVEQQAPQAKSSLPSKTFTKGGVPAPAAGWHTWYWGNGVQFLFWWREGGGGIRAVELNRSRLVADIIELLPSSSDSYPEARERARLVEAQGQVLYEWGSGPAISGERPLLLRALSPPFQAWHFQYFIPQDLLPSTGSLLLSFVGLGAAIGACLLLLGIYFYRESSRELREAAQRVSFVNHVSHELKTPLTNIRLYAELLEEELAEGDPSSQHARIIAQESQRLSRLIGNLLTFARKQRKQLSVHPKPEEIDALIAEAAELHRPRLQAKGMEMKLELAAKMNIALDKDAFDQMLYNLLSNAEKYAAQGGRVVIRSRQEGTGCVVDVCDEGPGVPPQERERIFRPFYRLHDALQEGVSGTGLGLSLARELARLHGGDVTCETWEGRGACFRLSFPGDAA